eukprot:CAMPEP_0171470518 /NCGR_PEP_ID=MMETSP0946-20130122/195_1 /TAXON_ID=109269 /ORGANISM="Vaucheria litorea, Strain CCMP2940" /LENGTH=429 /DNA_ID=CAMNT_0011999909 /DNA_START=187 /DNA_END=1473 /DNA_ORIENTATION=-
MVVGVGILVAYDLLVSRTLKRLGLSLPSSLISMISAFIFLNGYAIIEGDEKADEIGKFLNPAVVHLGKWMPLYLAPPLIILPNSLNEMESKGISDLLKMGGVHAFGWIFTLTSTGFISKTIEDVVTQFNQKNATKSFFNHTSISSTVNSDRITTNKEPNEKNSNPKNSNQEKMMKAWRIITASSYMLAPFIGMKPATFSTTIYSLLLGNSMPTKLKSIIHPLVTCSMTTAIVAIILGHSKGLDMNAALCHYFTKKGIIKGSSGDVFFGLLNACCTALGVRMFYSRKILFENSIPLLASSLISSAISVFGTTAACGALGITPKLSLTLAQRSVMSSLGISAANMLGGNPGLAVFSILLTGIYGASFGRSVLDKIGLHKKYVVSRGIATGVSAHSIGTSALLEEEPDAAAISSVSLCFAGIFHTIICSIPH